MGASFRWYVGAQVVSLAGTTMGYTALFWLGLHVPDGGAIALAAIDAVMMAPMLVFSRRAGTFVSRHQPRRILIGTQALQAVAVAAIALIMVATRMTLGYLLPICFLIGCVQTVDVTARQMFMLDLVGDDNLRRGTSRYAAATGLAKIAGPSLAGLIIAAAGETAVFFIDAISFLTVIAVLVRLADSPGHASTQTPGARRFGWLLDLPRGVRAAIVQALLVGGFGWQFAVTNPLMAKYVLHLGSAGFGLMGTCIAVGAVAGSVYSSQQRNPSRSEFAVWSLLFGLAECGAAVMPTAWAYDLLLFLLGGTMQLFSVSATVYVQRTTPQAQRAHALSAYNAAYMGFVPAGAFFAAALATTAGTRWALIGPGLVIAVCAGSLLAAGAGAGRGVRTGSALRSAGTTGRSG
jgi:predicted MFS family arabinose efflux permease